MRTLILFAVLICVSCLPKTVERETCLAGADHAVWEAADSECDGYESLAECPSGARIKRDHALAYSRCPK